MQSSRLALPLLLAAALAGANVFKPPVIDDTAYLAVARQIAQTPLDPYGFEQFWYEQPEPANHVLAPPVLPYWLALGIRLLGEKPMLLKLWLFPIALLFVGAFDSLLRRFARGMNSPLLVKTCTRALSASVTYTRPAPSTATPEGRLNLPVAACPQIWRSST